MRRTKAWYAAHLKSAIAHQMMPVRDASARRERVLYKTAGFISVCCYPCGCVPLAHEIGKLNGIRYVARSAA